MGNGLDFIDVPAHVETSEVPSRPSPNVAATMLLLGGGVFLLYSYLIFDFLPPFQLNKYFSAARLVVHNEFPKERYVDFSLTYLSLHVLAQKLLAHAQLAIQLIQIVLTTFSTLLLFRILLKFYPFVLALLGAVAFSLNQAVIAHTQAFEPESMVLFFLLGFLFFMIREEWWAPVLAGSFLGLGFLTRPTFLPVFFVAPVFFILRHRKARLWLRSWALFAIPFLICFTVLVLRNQRALGTFYASAMNPGTVFFEGNNPNSSGQVLVYAPLVNEIALQTIDQPDNQHVVYRVFARKIAGRELSVAEVNSYWANKARNYILDYPARSIHHLARKLFYFFHAYEWHDLVNTYWNQKRLARSLIPTVPFALISALAVLGLMLQLKDWRPAFPFYAVLFCQIAVVLLVYVSSRQRLAVVPVLIFFACGAVNYFFKHRKRAWIALAILPLGLVLHLPSEQVKEEDHLWKGSAASDRLLNLSVRSRDSGQLVNAARLASRALAAAPWQIDEKRPRGIAFGPDGFAASAIPLVEAGDFSGRLDRVTLDIQAGRLHEAEKELLALIRENHAFKRDAYQSSQPQFYLGLVAAKRGDRELALAHFQAVLKRAPGDPWALSCLYALSGQLRFQEQLLRYFDDIDAHFYLGTAYLDCGEPEKAVDHFSAVIDLLPDYRRGLLYLAAALARSGRIEEAASCYKTAMKVRFDIVLFEQDMIPVFERRVRENPSDWEKLYDLGVVLSQFGRYQEALETQQSALKTDPSQLEIQREIVSLTGLLTAAERNKN